MWPLHHKRKTNHEPNEEDRNKLAIGYRLILGLLVSVFAVTAFAAPYRASKDGSVVWDQATGFVWARCSVGQMWDGKTCKGEPKGLNFNQLFLIATEFNAVGGLSGFRDWAVPTVRQLATLRMCTDGYMTGKEIDIADGGKPLEAECSNSSISAAINGIVFPNVEIGMCYGSSSSHGADADCVNYYHGLITTRRMNEPYLHLRLIHAKQITTIEAAAAFPVPLSEFSAKDIARKAQEDKDRSAKNRAVYERNRATFGDGVQMCIAKRETCRASCPRDRILTYSPDTSCRERCDNLPC
jgi:Protein of unknown function (DUF1566)